MIDIDLYSLLENVKEAIKNQLEATCPFCEKKEGHFFIKKKTDELDKRGNNKSYQYRCLKCDESGGLYSLLKHLDRLDLVKQFKNVSIFSEKLLQINLNNEIKQSIIFDEKSLTLAKETPPIGFKRIYSHDYLLSRGITEEDFQKYKFGTTKLLSKYKDRIILLIEENDVCVGYIARSMLSKEDVKLLKERGISHARYINSVSEFGKMLMGYEEIVEGVTETAIIVEGAFDKTNITTLLDLYNDDYLKCLCSFGKKISDVQIYKLQKKGIKNIILMFDPDAYSNSIKYGYELSKYFNVLVAKLTDCDPGDIKLEELLEVMNNLQSPIQFSLNTIEGIIL